MSRSARHARRLQRTLEKAERVRAKLGVEQLDYTEHRAQVDELVVGAIEEADEVLGGEGGGERAMSVLQTLREVIHIDNATMRRIAEGIVSVANVKLIPDAVEVAVWTLIIQTAYRTLKGAA